MISKRRLFAFGDKPLRHPCPCPNPATRACSRRIQPRVIPHAESSRVFMSTPESSRGLALQCAHGGTSTFNEAFQSLTVQRLDSAFNGAFQQCAIWRLERSVHF